MEIDSSVAKSEKKSSKSHVLDNVSLSKDEQAKFDKKVKQIKKNDRGDGSGPGVVWVGHIPHGFFEPQMRAFFSQFGTVNRLRIARSKKTGRIKGYGYIEFESDVVAKIVADTMNNYLLFDKLLKCEYVAKSSVPMMAFVGCNRMFKRSQEPKRFRTRYNNTKTLEREMKCQQQGLDRLNKKMEQLQELGINYSLNVEIQALDDEVNSDDTSDVNSMKQKIKLTTIRVSSMPDPKQAEESQTTNTEKQSLSKKRKSGVEDLASSSEKIPKSSADLLVVKRKAVEVPATAKHSKIEKTRK